MSSVRVRGAICAISCAAVVMGPLQASAGNALPHDKYQCFKYKNSTWTYSGYDLTILDEQNYEFSKEDWTGTGEYRLGKGKKLLFTKGYLKKEGFKGKHSSTSSGHQVDLIKKSKKSGKPTYNCAS